MGGKLMMMTLLNSLFGNNRNVLRETVEVFRENAEAGAARDSTLTQAALAQFAQEFQAPKGSFERLMDGLNRLPRPMLALGTLGLMISAMVDPLWFAARMQGIALVPEPLWWLLGIVVSFYFGGRAQLKSQEFQSSMAKSYANAQQVMTRISHLNSVAQPQSENPALMQWHARKAAAARRG